MARTMFFVLFCLKEQCNLRDLVKKKKSVTIFEACKYLKYSSKINVFLRNNKLQICSIILMYAFWYRGMSSGTWLLCAFNFLMGIGIHFFFFLQLEIVIVPLIWYLTNSIFYTLKLWQKLCHFAKQVQASFSTLSVSCWPSKFFRLTSVWEKFRVGNSVFFYSVQDTHKSNFQSRSSCFCSPA